MSRPYSRHEDTRCDTPGCTQPVYSTDRICYTCSRDLDLEVAAEAEEEDMHETGTDPEGATVYQPDPLSWMPNDEFLDYLKREYNNSDDDRKAVLKQAARNRLQGLEWEAVEAGEISWADQYSEWLENTP